MLTVTAHTGALNVAKGQEPCPEQGLSSETWPPDVFNAVIELLSEILVREYQSTHSTGSAPCLTFSKSQRHRPSSTEAVRA